MVASALSDAARKSGFECADVDEEADRSGDVAALGTSSAIVSAVEIEAELLSLSVAADAEAPVGPAELVVVIVARSSGGKL